MRLTRFAAAAAALTLLAAPAAAEDFTDEGFIKTWLVLAPIPLDACQSGADAVEKEQVKDEAALKPKAGDKVTAKGKELAWKKHQCGEHLLDFNGLLGNQTEDSVGYAVAYVVAGEEMKGVNLKVGSDDQVRVYLNGKEVIKHTEPRSAEKDQNTAENVTLNKGVNVLVIKVVNEKVDFSACARFTDKSDNPVKGLKVQTQPE